MVPTFFQRFIAGSVFSLIVLLTVGSCSYKKGYDNGFAAAQRELQPLIDRLTKQLDQVRADAQTHAAQLQAAANTLSNELAAARLQLETEKTEVIRYVSIRARPDRLAIDRALTRMLNSLSGVRESTESGPEPDKPSERPDPARTETASDPGRSGTSERAVSEWIAGAIQSHEACRQQADKLIRYARVCASGGVAIPKD